MTDDRPDLDWLDAVREPMVFTAVRFSNGSLFSNFMEHHPIEIEPRWSLLDPSIYGVPQTAPTVEHVYQAAKARHFHDAMRIMAAPSPGVAKGMGRRVDMRRDWEQVKGAVMLHALRQKFDGTLPSLRQALVDTFPHVLIEETTGWCDTIWGQCWCSRHQGEGLNLLGHCLMTVRAEILAQTATPGWKA